MLTPAASYGEGSSVVRTRVTASAPCGRGRSSPRASSSFRSGAFAGGKRECHRNAGTNRAKCVLLVRMEFGPLHGGIRDWIIPAGGKEELCFYDEQQPKLATATAVPYSGAASCVQHTYCTKVYGLISLNKTPAPYLPQVRGCIGLEMRDNGGLYLLPDREVRQMGCVNTK